MVNPLAIKLRKGMANFYTSKWVSLHVMFVQYPTDSVTNLLGQVK